MRSLKTAWSELTEEQRNVLRGRRAMTLAQPQPQGQGRMVEPKEQGRTAEEPPPAPRVPPPFRKVEVEAEHRSNVTVRGPCCTRPKVLDNLMDISTMPAELRADFLSKADLPTDLDAICGTCLGRVFRRGAIKRSEFYRALGAPPGLVAKLERAE